MLRSTLLKLSASKGFANWVTSNGNNAPHGWRFVPVRRWMKPSPPRASAITRACTPASINLGENVATISDAQRSRDAISRFLNASPGRAARQRFRQLTQLGLDINIEFCEGLVRSIVERAAGFDNFLRIDMEGSLYTQRTIDLVKRVSCAESRRRHGHSILSVPQ